MAPSKQQRAKAAAAAAKNAASTPAATTAEVTAPAIHDKKPAGQNQSTVFVACKMPRGIYLQVFSFHEQDQRVMGGGIEKRKVAMRMPEGKFRIKPTSLAFGLIPNYPIVDGFSITRDVPADLWRTWLEQNAKLELVTHGLIAGFDDEASAIAYAREFAKQRTGLEPIDPTGDARVEQTQNPNLSDVEIDDARG